MNEKEKTILIRKAHKAGMSVSEFIRASAIHSDDSQIRIIDVQPLRDFLFELTKQGTNLNQFIKFLHTYGVESLSARRAQKVLDDEQNLFERGKNILIGLQKEIEANKIHLTKEREK
ncbi:TPA: hypothetical protein TU158_001745 [Streptococcus equi subsp. zooepidemicus]|nr:hypothetical protein [Streptococcus equi subsp. zooepidemicus]